MAKFGELIPCIQSSPFGIHAVLIGPEHPEYCELYERNERAANLAELYYFENKILRPWWAAFFALVLDI